MSTKELKEILKERIDYIQDEAAIQRILDMVNEEVVPYELNDKQKAAIDIARTQIENGEYLTNEQVKENTRKWLGK
jgi:predicted transcriptional regulator